MFIDLKDLLRSGKDGSNFFFEYVPDEKLLDIPEAEISSPVKISGEVTLTGNHSAFIEGEVVFTVRGECTRCLKETEKEFCFSFKENVDGKEGSYPLDHDRINLKEIVDDLIVTDMPVEFLCSDGCKGICAGCGVNLNDEPCKCEK